MRLDETYSDLDAEVTSEPKAYRFKKNWFKPKIPIWERFVGEFKGRPDIKYLEIGVHEGSSFFWVMDNVLTHPSSRAVVIDLFSPSYADVFRHNLKVSGAADRVVTIQGRGEVEAKKLEEDTFDIIYIDGGHAAQTVFAQAALTWPLLKTNGILIFDDYHWRKGKWPLDLRPELSIDTFVTAYSRELDLLSRERNVFVRKVGDRLGPNCSKFFDSYFYNWSKRTLHAVSDGCEIQLSHNEKAFVEVFLLSLKPSQVKPELTTTLAQDPAFASLQERLGLVLAN